MELLQNPEFWIGLIKIIWINIILSGDNAVVIALAARSLPAEQQKKAIMFGSGAAVVLRIGLTVVAAKLLELSYLQIVGGLLLLWVGTQLLHGEDEGDEGDSGKAGLWVAIRTILIADLVMSLDNVIGGSRRQGQHDLVDSRLSHQHSFGHFWQPTHDQVDGPLPDHHLVRRRPDRLGWRRNHRQRRRTQIHR